MKKIAYPLVFDVAGVVFAGFGVLVLLSLSSYSPADNSVSIYGASAIHNWVGPGGALVSNFLFTVFGLTAFCVPAFLFYGSMRLFLRHPIWENKIPLAGGTLLVLSVASLFHAVGFLSQSISFMSGGLVGNLIFNAMSKVLSSTGAVVVTMCLFLIGSLMFTGLSLAQNAAVPSQRFKQLGRFIADFVKRIFSRKQKEEIASHPSDFLPFKVYPNPEVSDVSLAPQLIVLPPVDDATANNTSLNPLSKRKSFNLPALKLLDYDAAPVIPIDEGHLRSQAERLEKTFAQFGVSGHIREIRPGPVVTLFEFVPAPGIKLTKIASLADDIAMAMVAMHVRIVAPMPGKGAVGIEIPNERRETVYLKEIVSSPNFKNDAHPLCMALGKTIEGKAYFANLAEMPHVLIAGTTGSGKSVSVNAMICSILYRATPDDVRFIFIDPKMLELSIYDGIPHLLMPPIIDSKKAANALKWAVREMDHRYQLLNELGVRDIDGYNQKCSKDRRMSYIVIVVDEYADLISVAGQEVESHVMRLAQKARACGIHVMLATQRPSVDIITGVIKANFPVRIGFRLASVHDSKTIINRSGAESLLGRGDMLLIPPGTSDVVRVHGAYVSEKELSRVVDHWKAQGEPNYDPTLVVATEEAMEEQGVAGSSYSDEKYQEAIDIVIRTRKCSTSWLQRQLGVGYNRAARLVEQMEKEGIVGPIQNPKGEREIFKARTSSDSVYPS